MRGPPSVFASLLGPHIPLFQLPPSGGADGVFALLEGGEVGFDPGRMAIFLQGTQHALRGADRGAVGLRGVDPELGVLPPSKTLTSAGPRT